MSRISAPVFSDVVGMTILTPHGVETILAFDNARDMAHTGHGHDYRWEDIHGNGPPPDATPEERADWLDAPELILASSKNVGCTCTCGKANRCSHLVTIRGASKTVSHQRNNGCACGEKAECCAYPLEP